MIRYSLKCENGHSFESWFASAEAFEKLHGASMVACAVCGATKVEKALMTPALRSARKAAPVPTAPEAPAAMPSAQAPAHPLSEPQDAAEALFDAMRRKVEETSDYVGADFTAEARAMHAGLKPERSIHGEAKIEDAKALLEEGIPVTPLPIVPKRRRN
ncbi:DUF1178 family protein [Rhodobacter lacus]|uniref:DUF1178 family protein n=1 Tax=Rhodobacter lacus TaxID=1641972 RepID=A0ABW5AAZ5_9RHOB